MSQQNRRRTNTSNRNPAETLTMNQTAANLCKKMCNELEASADLKVLAMDHASCPPPNVNAMKVFCSSFLTQMIGAHDIFRERYARLACELMTVWNNSIVTPNGQQDSFVRRLQELTQGAFESMDANDKKAACDFAMTLGEMYKATVITQRVLSQVLNVLLSDENYGDCKVEWACHIVNACGSALPESFVNNFLPKFEALRPRITNDETKKNVTEIVDKLQKLILQRLEVCPLSEAYTDAYADFHALRSKIVGETTSILQRDIDELRDAVEGSGERLEDTFQQRLKSTEDVLNDLKAELATLNQELGLLAEEA
jgi:hypothetical protein